ncbi:hypothetical protein QFZ91_000802 [Paraburkholderia sp. JPY419]
MTAQLGRLLLLSSAYCEYVSITGRRGKRSAYGRPCCRSAGWTTMRGCIMKWLIQAVALAGAIAAPMASFAQSDQPVTRDQVKAELLQLEQNGYNPAAKNDAQYPADIQAAEARVAAQRANGQDTSGYGAPLGGSSQSGSGQHPMVVNPDGQ